MSVGVMKDYKLKQRNLRASHTLGGSRFGICTKKTAKYDEKESLIREHFEYVEFMWKERFRDLYIFVKINHYVEFLYRDVPYKFDVILK